MGVDPWALAKPTMDSLPSVWTSHHESVEELIHKLLCATWELEALQSSIEEERREREENMNQLIQILKVTTQERDEAREQLHYLLLEKISEPDNLAELVRSLSVLHPHGPQICQPRGNSVVAMESETPNHHHSYGSSPPAESFFVTGMNGAVDTCTMGLPQQPLLCENDHSSSSTGISPGTAKYDRADAIIDILSAKRPLPEKGKLLETMLKIGPMLETLMVAGLLPHWRNPPPALQSNQVPPVTIKACYAQLLNRATVLNSNNSIQSYFM